MLSEIFHFYFQIHFLTCSHQLRSPGTWQCHQCPQLGRVQKEAAHSVPRVKDHAHSKGLTWRQCQHAHDLLHKPLLLQSGRVNKCPQVCEPRPIHQEQADSEHGLADAVLRGDAK